MKREYVTIPKYWIKVLEYFVFMAFLKDGNTLWSEDTARIKLPQPKYSSTVSVEKALLEKGCDGNPGGGDDDAVYVYAYLKSSITEP